MAITVKHKFVSAIPDGDDATIVRPSNWNDTHELTGLGTMAEQNANAVAITGGTLSNATLTSDTVSNNLAFTPTTAPSYVEGDVWYDSTTHALAYYNDSPAAVVHIGQDLQIKVINNTGSTIANGTPVYITSTSSGQTYPNIALAKADVASTSSVIGLTNGAIANGAIGYVTGQGTIDGVNTGTFTVGQVLYLSPYSAGQLMNTIPPTGITVQVGVVSYVNSSTGKIYVKQTTPLAVPASIITGVLPVANGGTGVTTSTGSGSNVLNTSPTLTTPAITGGTIDNTVIGGTTPAAGTFTTITGQTATIRGTGQNLLIYSEDLTNAAWNGSGTTASIVSTSFATNTSQLVQTSSGYWNQGFLNGSNENIQGKTYTMSAWIWSTTDVGKVMALRAAGTAGGSGLNLPITLTSTPTRYSVTFTYTGASDQGAVLVLDNRSGAGGDGLAKTYLVWGAQIEESNIVGSYNKTTSTILYGTPSLSFAGVTSISLDSSGNLSVSPAGTGALQAQATTSTTAGGNARGANAVDWQTSRGSAGNVASAPASVLNGGTNNTVSATGASLGGGGYNSNAGNYSFLGGGNSNTISSTAGGNTYGALVGGYGNTAGGTYNFIGGGYTNSGTSASAVTTQSATMNGTTAVTLSGSNASIKVGQLITGTSIANFTYVAAISGTSLTLSQNASGSSTSTLSFFTPHGVVVGGGNNQATGAYSFIGGGGDAGTAANRNVASGAWSTIGGGAKNTASGAGSTIGGGGTDGTSYFANLASGTTAFIGGGWNNTAGGALSVICGGTSNNSSGADSFIGGGDNHLSNGAVSAIMGGRRGSTRGITGYHAFPACYDPLGTTQGLSQSALLVLAKQTTDATATILTCDGAAAGTTNQVILPNNSAYYFKVSVIAGVTGAGNTKAWTLEGAIKRGANAASTAIVGTVTTTIVAADVGAATWTVTATADTTNGGLAITVTGQAATTIRWVARAESTEMTF